MVKAKKMPEVPPLPVVRKGLPPLAYKVQYDGYKDESGHGFLGLRSVPAGWVYTVGIVNLRTAAQPNIEIGVRYRGESKLLMVHPMGKQLYHEPHESLASNTWTYIAHHGRPVVMLLPTLPSGTASFLQIGVVSSSRPSFDDIDITVMCAEGEFQRMTPTQWEQIGWEDD